MAFGEALAGRIRQRLARRKNVEEKKMFGGIGFLINGNLLVGVRKDSLLVRLGPEQSDEALREAHVSEFKITGRGTMKGWVVVAPKALRTTAKSRHGFSGRLNSSERCLLRRGKHDPAGIERRADHLRSQLHHRAS
jgi:TfoX/Sxy family transcriptional regulator of competence genes